MWRLNWRSASVVALLTATIAFLALGGIYLIRLYATGFPFADLEADARSLPRIGIPIAIVVGLATFLARLSLLRGFSALSFARAVFAVAVPAAFATWLMDALPPEHQPDLYSRAIYASLAAVGAFLVLVQTTKEDGKAIVER